MELTKYSNHRSAAYLNWLRKQTCVISGRKAECAHHIRLGTNGGVSLKPSDYFCIPLRNEYHTTGLFALHVIGEETFIKQFKLNIHSLFVKYLKEYITHKYKILIDLKDKSDEQMIAYLIQILEEKDLAVSPVVKKKASAKAKSEKDLKIKLKGNEFYEKAKILKREKDKELRQNIKATTKREKVSTSLVGNEFYEKAKELKRSKDKELRDKLKENAKKEKSSTKLSLKNNEFYQKSKELKRQRDKELRDKIKQAKKASK
ncbi:DUF968 domain-containing protein [Bacteriovorax sp. Seq25_V]|uniref:DUF968 domain-containing protein n=1 Tax=Bacteriovorax sp. Seq25_V TaxID=1201288 RepID=UPI00038A041B|nr:DUF968 domain-containing protein [Bacteriovorax sp. Seq25_V]EQC44048.1 PF06147 domain protein [Bacteriovorax sp. Seq25_V]